MCREQWKDAFLLVVTQFELYEYWWNTEQNQEQIGCQ